MAATPMDICSAPPPSAGPQYHVAVPLPNFGPVNGVIRQYQADERRNEAQQLAAWRAARARECTPHPASAMYSGTLTPVADVRPIVNGKTLYLDTAIVAGRQLVRWKEDAMYLAANGKSYSPRWTDQPWHVEGNAVCMTGHGSACMGMFTDSDNALYMQTPENLLLKLARTEDGDSAGVRAAYAQDQRNTQLRNAAALAILGALFGGGSGSGGGGGGGSGTSSAPDADARVMMQQQDRLSQQMRTMSGN